MMKLHGKNFVGAELSASGEVVFHAVNPGRSEPLEPPFHEATPEEVDRAMRLAAESFQRARQTPWDTSKLLDAVAEEVMSLGPALIERAMAETGLPEARLTGERHRTVSQIRMFAELVREGSWVDARIDRAIPDRAPVPKPDVRQMLIPIGPVVVFGASNFPLAFSVAGGDTASALAAGNPVVVKAHPAHPGTSELVAGAFRRAIEGTETPTGYFSMLHGSRYEIGLSLVRHPLTQAVGFTGSLSGGRALFDAAASRPNPIPLYAEMGSINPVFVLTAALEKKAGRLAQGLHQSVTLGVGQFCTNPGLVVGIEGEALNAFVEDLGRLTAACVPGTMLHEGIRKAYEQGIERMSRVADVHWVNRSESPSDPAKNQVPAAVFKTNARTFIDNAALSEEVFGPSTLVVACGGLAELEAVAYSLNGQLTATIHGTSTDLERHRSLISVLETKVGRLIFNGFPTGVEVCPAMHHGGPYPATSDMRTTSVGTNAIKRFARPICYQGFPDEALPIELKDQNAKGIWRLVDGGLSREAV